MTDLTFCYVHMSPQDLHVLDTIETPDYLDGELSDEELEIPSHMAPPSLDDSDILPSQIHPSYPYGNPLSLRHPAARPRRPNDLASRALFEDMTHNGGGINGSLRWKDLALDILLPIDQEKAEAERAAHARRMASGAPSGNSGVQSAPPPGGPETGEGDGDGEESGEEEGEAEVDVDDEEDEMDENDESGEMDEE